MGFAVKRRIERESGGLVSFDNLLDINVFVLTFVILNSFLYI